MNLFMYARAAGSIVSFRQGCVKRATTTATVTVGYLLDLAGNTLKVDTASRDFALHHAVPPSSNRFLLPTPPDRQTAMELRIDCLATKRTRPREARVSQSQYTGTDRSAALFGIGQPGTTSCCTGRSAVISSTGKKRESWVSKVLDRLGAGLTRAFSDLRGFSSAP